VYAVPKTDPVDGVEIRLDDPSSSAALDWTWERDGRGPGLVIPDRSAAVYLPPLAGDQGALEIDLASAGEPGGLVPIAVAVDEAMVRVTEAPSPSAGVRRFTARVALPRFGRAVAVRLDPAKRGARLRAVAVRMGPTK
jgi:hypothetical protein